MKTRKLGSQGLTTSAIGFGCMGLSTSYGKATHEHEGERLLRAAVDLGITIFDTAEVYGPYSNELLVGRALAPVRDKVTIATKFGFNIQNERVVPGLNSRPENIREVWEKSRARLQTDVIDIFYQHRVDPDVPIEEVAGTVGELVQEGKVRYFGLSEAGIETLRRANNTFPVSVLQNEYSIWTRMHEDSVVPIIEELGIGMVAFSPLGRGYLTGQINATTQFPEDDYRLKLPRFTQEALQKNQALIELLNVIAKINGVTTAQVSLAWLLNRKPWIVPIPGTTNTQRLVENCEATEVTLPISDIDRIDTAFRELGVFGDRYPEPTEKQAGL